MRIALVLAALLAAVPAFAADRSWTRTQIGAEAAFVALVAVDAWQTSTALREARFYEVNPLLGERPSDARLFALAGSAALLHVVIAHIIPSDYRGGWQASGLALEMMVVGRNFHAGARLRF